MKIIEVVVRPNGETTVQTRGFTGSDCLEASKFLERALGTVVSDAKTAEFFTANPQQQEIQQ
jgi:hypothetical protein